MKMTSSDLCLLAPLPGELFSSTVARSHLVFGYRSKSNTMIKALGSRRLPHTAPYNLCLYNDPLTAYRHTVLPFYLSAWFLKRQSEALKTVFQPFGQNLTGKIKLNFKTQKFFNKPALSFCPLCLISDEKKYGMPYFHSQHQLQGITACSEHRVQLVEYSPQKHGEKILAVLKPQDYQDPIPASEREILYSSWVPAFTELSLEYLYAVYHQHLLKTDPKLFRYQALYEIAQDFFGKEYLAKVGCLNVADPVASRNRRIVSFASLKSRITHPFYHLMFWEMLGLKPENFQEPVSVILKNKRFEPYPFSQENCTLIKQEFGADHYYNETEKIFFVRYHPLNDNDYKLLGLANIF